MVGMQDIIWLLDIGRYICKILIAEMYVLTTYMVFRI